MEIKSEDHPNAGEEFRFSVSGAPGPKSVKAYIEYRIVLEKVFSGDAASEVIAIPPRTGTFTLKILVRDSAGENAEMRYVIRGDAPAEGTTTL